MNYCFNSVKNQIKISEYTGKNNEDYIIGGQDTCQGDSGGPLWVEEDGRGIHIYMDKARCPPPSLSFPFQSSHNFLLFDTNCKLLVLNRTNRWLRQNLRQLKHLG